MPDLSELAGAGATKIVGAGANGIENEFIGSLARQLFMREVPDATFSFRVDASALANLKSHIALWNGSASSVLRLSAVYLINNRTTATTGTAVDFRLYRFTTAPTGGTALTAFQFDTADALPAGVTAASGATVTGENANYYRRWLWSSDEWGPGTVDVEAQDHAFSQMFPAYHKIDGDKRITIRPNEGVHIRQLTNTTSGDFDFLFVFTVEPT